MDSFVTARVPVELKTQVAERLAKIGATQSDLVNAAFAYVLDTGRMPAAKASTRDKRRVITPELQRAIMRRMEDTSFQIPEEAWEGEAYKDALVEGRTADYEALS